jgi:hypothetical protein
MFLSSTVRVVELIVVVVPFIVKSPVTVKLARVPTEVIADKLPVVTTVPVTSGRVMVRSAVGSVTVSVVSKSFADEPSITIEESESVSPETAGLVKVLFVSVCVPLSVTTPDGISVVRATVPVLVGSVRVAAPLVIDEITGAVRVLFVRVSVPSIVAKSASDIAVLNSAFVPLTVFVANEIDLFVNVFVDDAVTAMSLVSATVPVASGNVIVRSAVGSPAERVSSKLFAVEPSITIDEVSTPNSVML